MNNLTAPQIKICGLTIPEEAAACAAMGADAVGLVFFPPSPRHVSLAQARAVSDVLPDHVPAVGVFVNPAWEEIVQVIEYCGLGAVQLHGTESPAFIDRLQEQYKVLVIKGLFAAKPPTLSEAWRYKVTGYLVECGKGPLPGGNAMAWDWGAACGFALTRPTILAGGLTPDNVAEAVTACLPDAVDASSGLEACPGRKDPDKVARFIANVRGTAQVYRTREKTLKRIFS